MATFYKIYFFAILMLKLSGENIASLKHEASISEVNEKEDAVPPNNLMSLADYNHAVSLGFIAPHDGPAGEKPDTVGLTEASNDFTSTPTTNTCPPTMTVDNPTAFSGMLIFCTAVLVLGFSFAVAFLGRRYFPRTIPCVSQAEINRTVNHPKEYKDASNQTDNIPFAQPPDMDYDSEYDTESLLVHPSNSHGVLYSGLAVRGDEWF